MRESDYCQSEITFDANKSKLVGEVAVFIQFHSLSIPRIFKSFFLLFFVYLMAQCTPPFMEFVDNVLLNFQSILGTIFKIRTKGDFQ